MQERSACAGIAPKLRVLVVTPDDRRFRDFESVVSDRSWEIFRCCTIGECLKDVIQQKIAVIFTDAELADGSWQVLLDAVQSCRNAPHVIVFSQTPDDRFWMDVLQAGGYDLIALPFDRLEVLHAGQTAWLSWQKKAQGARSAWFPAESVKGPVSGGDFRPLEGIRA